jgi:very-short-patch-repair endonuclease
MTLNRTFLNILKKKLSYGSTRSVLLNCVPGRLISRIALSDFNIATPDAANAFLQKLLTEKSFEFTLPIPFQEIIETMSEAEKDACIKANGEKTKLEKRLASLQYDQDDFEKEYGVKTFGIGFPLIIRRNPNDLTKLICAPLFIWPLQIKKSYTRNREWVLVRDPEQGIRVNEALRAYLKTEQHLELPLPDDAVLDDSLLTTEELDAFLLRLKAIWSDIQMPPNGWVPTQLPAQLDPQKESATQPRIVSEGVFALYKNLKQSLIQDIELLISDSDTGLERDPLDAWFHKSSPVNVDPSQHAVLRSLAKENRVVIQGPPGTGKSQTLTAIIATALTNRKKVMVVCEKRTALEVIYNNLIKRFPFLQPAIAFVEDVTSDRQTIVRQFRERESSMPNLLSDALVGMAQQESDQFETMITSLESNYETLRTKIKDNKRWADWVAEWLSAKVPSAEAPGYEVLARYIPAENPQSVLAQQTAWLKNAQKAWTVHRGFTEPVATYFQPDYKSTAANVIRQLRAWQYELSNLAKQWQDRVADIEKNCLHQAQTELQSSWEAELSAWQDALATIGTQLVNPYSVSVMDSMRLLFNSRSAEIKQASATAQTLQQQFLIRCEQWGGASSENPSDYRKHFPIWQKAWQAQCLEKTMASDTRLQTDQARVIQALTPIQQAMQAMLVTTTWPSQLSTQLEAMKVLLNDIMQHESAITAYWQWRDAEDTSDGNLKTILPHLQEHAFTDWAEAYRLAHVYALLRQYHTQHALMRDETALDTIRTVMHQLAGVQEQAMEQYIHHQFAAGLRGILQQGIEPKKLYNLKGSAGTTRNSLRKIVQFAPEAFLQLHPLVLANPSTCSSLFPMQSGFFDLVIFDEASQLRIEDTLSALIRGKAVVVSGDSQQMPPSSYFESNNLLLDDSDLSDDLAELSEQDRMLEESNLEMAGKESLLEWAIEEGYCETSLDMHYRSRHPDLIEFSNTCFYRSRLVPMPETHTDIPIRFFQVDGVYDKRVNDKEADEIIRMLRTEIPNNVSVGVATFNLTQRNLILDKISLARTEDPDFHTKMSALDQLGFFVKNLENIQGDERDILMLSTTFGKRGDGKFIMNFGPITQRNGHRLLNVIITRARSKVYVFTSIPADRQTEYRQAVEAEGRVSGKSGLLAYLEYARLVSEGQTQAKLDMLQFIQMQVNKSMFERGKAMGLTESPFEEEVFQYLAEQLGVDRLVPQYRCGGFRIDLVVTLPGQERKIAIECDGAAYHSDELTWHHDIYRQQQLEGQGFVFHRIWSTRWWENRSAEEQQLITFIRNLEATS